MSMVSKFELQTKNTNQKYNFFLFFLKYTLKNLKHLCGFKLDERVKSTNMFFSRLIESCKKDNNFWN